MQKGVKGLPATEGGSLYRLKGTIRVLGSWEPTRSKAYRLGVNPATQTMRGNVAGAT